MKSLKSGRQIFCKLNTIRFVTKNFLGLPRWLSDKESACNAGDAEDTSSVPGSGRSPGGGNGNALQYSCLENPWAKEPGGLQPMGSQRRAQLKPLSTAQHPSWYINFLLVVERVTTDMVALNSTHLWLSLTFLTVRNLKRVSKCVILLEIPGGESVFLLFRLLDLLLFLDSLPHLSDLYLCCYITSSALLP